MYLKISSQRILQGSIIFCNTSPEVRREHLSVVYSAKYEKPWWTNGPKWTTEETWESLPVALDNHHPRQRVGHEWKHHGLARNLLGIKFLRMNICKHFINRNCAIPHLPWHKVEGRWGHKLTDSSLEREQRNSTINPTLSLYQPNPH